MTAVSGNKLLSILRRLNELFRRKKIPYALIGAWALAVWGRPRATLDFDFLVFVDEESLARLGETMTKAGMAIDESWVRWNPMLRGIQLRLQSAGMPIDLLRPRDRHDAEILKRRRRKRLGDGYCWVVAPEDLILQKLKTGRPRDFEDVLSVLERSGRDLDVGYVRKWATRLGIRAELDYVLNQM